MSAQTRSCTTTAASGSQGRIVGTAGRAKHRIIRLGTETEFRGVGLADKDCSLDSDSRNQQAVTLRNAVGIDWRTTGGAHAGYIGKVLDGMGHAVHPTPVLVSRQRLIRIQGLGEQFIIIHHAHNGVVNSIVSMNALQIGLHDFDTTGLTLPDSRRQIGCAQVGQIGRQTGCE